MVVAVFGATGGTGRQLIMQALKSGYELKALVRSPEKLNIKHDNLIIIQGDVRESQIVRKTLESTQAVLSCLGVGLGKEPVIADGIKIIAHAMNDLGIKRIIVESAYGAGTPRAGFYGRGLRYLIPKLIKDKEIMEEILKNSDLDFTIIRPASLTNGVKEGHYKFGTDFAPHGYPKISRADVADFMLKQIVDSKFIRKAVNISY